MNTSSRSELAVKAGDEQLEAGDLAAAEALYHQALNLDESCLDAIWSIGCVASQRGDHKLAATWAKKALAIDPNYKRAKCLLGNSLFGLEKYEEALATLQHANLGEEDLPSLAQIGLLLEKLDRFEEAEAALRSVVEHDPVYITRGATLGLNSYNPFYADMYHALARVLQRQGKREEAWLHYHLARRTDPEIELDNMYLEILTEDDLENHPFFDQRQLLQPPPDADFAEHVRFILLQPTYDDAVKAAKESGAAKRLEEIAGLIQSFQHDGKFLLSARLRIVGDVANGQDARPLWDGLQLASWQSLLELAEVWRAGELEKEDALSLAEDVAVEDASVEALRDLAYRFGRLEPQTGLYLAAVGHRSLARSRSPEVRISAHQLWADLCFRLNRLAEAGETLDLAYREIEAGADLRQANGVFTNLCRIRIELSQGDEALAKARRFVELAGLRGTPAQRISAKWLHSQILAQQGDIEESLVAANHVYELLKDYDDVEGQFDNVRRRLEDIASSLRNVEQTGAADPAPNANEAGLVSEFARAQDEANSGRLDAALVRLQQIKVRALNAGRYPLLVAILTQIGGVLIEQEKFGEAADPLKEALDRSAGLGPDVDVWPILFALSQSAEGNGEQGESVLWMEKALSQSIQEGSSERESLSHERLAYLLVNIDPGRALEHFDKVVMAGRPHAEKDSADLDPGEEALRAGNYPAAITELEEWLGKANPTDRRLPTATANLALARHATGSVDLAISLYQKAADQFLTSDNPSQAVRVLSRAVILSPETGNNPVPLLARLAQITENIDSPGVRRSCLTVAATTAADAGDHYLSEQMASKALELATGPEWQDLGDELTCRRALGRVFRVTGRYTEAVEQYDGALAIAKRLADESQQAAILGARAIAYRYLHRKVEALADYREAIEIANRFKDEVGAAQHQFNMVPVLCDLGRREEARSVLLDSLKIFDRHGAMKRALRVLMLLDDKWEISQLPADIGSRLEKCEDDALLSNEADLKGWGLLRKARRLAACGDLDGADLHFESAIEVFGSVGDRYNVASTHLNRAALLQFREPARAGREIASAHELARLMGHKGLMAECSVLFAEQAAADDRSEDVERHVETLFTIWLDLRSSLSSDSERIRFAEKIATTTERCIAFFASKSQYGRVFELMEWSRALALSDLIASRVEAVASSADDGLSEEGDGLPGAKQGTYIDNYQKPPKVQEAETLLKSWRREALIVCLDYLGEDLMGFIIRPGEGSPKLVNTGMSRGAVSELLARFRDEMLGEMRGKGALTWLSDAAPLVRAFGPHLKQDDLVVLLLDEELQILPFAGLALSDGELVADRVALVYAPSLAVVGQLKDRRGKRPKRERFDFASIGIAFPEEALAVLRIFRGGVGLTGNSLAKEEIRGRLRDKSIVHLSCHAHFNSKRPLESGLHLRSSSSVLLKDILSVRDLSRWHLDCDLITLSACESGLGQAIGNELIGLTRNFLAAGANAVVATLWPVDRSPTMKFMLRFYRELERRSGQGGEVDIAEALRLTQVHLAKETGFADWAAYKVSGWPFMALDAMRSSGDGADNE